jgi:hypothetical protein
MLTHTRARLCALRAERVAFDRMQLNSKVRRCHERPTQNSRLLLHRTNSPAVKRVSFPHKASHPAVSPHNCVDVPQTCPTYTRISMRSCSQLGQPYATMVWRTSLTPHLIRLNNRTLALSPQTCSWDYPSTPPSSSERSASCSRRRSSASANSRLGSTLGCSPFSKPDTLDSDSSSSSSAPSCRSSGMS